jgi:hypothetical protein
MKTFWRISQTLSVLTALFLVGLLLVDARDGLYITWNVLIPIVPAVLLIFPKVWRNVCPVAVVSQLPIHFRKEKPGRSVVNAKWGGTLMAVIAFLAIVPTRLALLNQNGTALAVFVLAVVVIALVTGAIYSGKSGWCSTICPVHPVEQIYGQQPLLDVPHAHCTTCTGCIRTCLDLDSTKSFDRLTTPRSADYRRSDDLPLNELLRTPMGIFASAFPGFIFGYFTADADYSLVTIYLWILMWCAASLALFTAIYLLVRLRRQTVLRWSAAVALVLYYWFSVPAVASATSSQFGTAAAPGWIIDLMRLLALLLVAVWLVKALRNSETGSNLARSTVRS